MASKNTNTKKINTSSQVNTTVKNNNGKPKKRKLRIFLLVFLNVAVVGTLIAGAVYHHFIKQKNNGYTVTLEQPSQQGWEALINGQKGPLKIKKGTEVTISITTSQSSDVVPSVVILTTKDGAAHSYTVVAESENTYKAVFTYDYDQDSTIKVEFRDKTLDDTAYIEIDGKNYAAEWASVCSLDEQEKLVFYNVKNPQETKEYDRASFTEADVHIGRTAPLTQAGFMANCTSFNKKVIFDSGSTITEIPDSFMINCKAFTGGTSNDEPFIPSTIQKIGIDFMAHCENFNLPIATENCQYFGSGFLWNCKKFNQPFSLDNAEWIFSNFMINCTSFNQKLTIQEKTRVESSFMINCTSLTEIDFNNPDIPCDDTTLSELVKPGQSPTCQEITIGGSAKEALRNRLTSIDITIEGTNERWVRKLKY